MIRGLLSGAGCSLLVLVLLSGCVQPGKKNVSAGNTQTVALRSMPSRTQAPLMTEQANGGVKQTAACMLSGIREFKIPAEFIVHDVYSRGETVKLVNPATGNDGLIFDLLPAGQGTKIDVYANGMDVSQRWRKMVSRCASQPGMAGS